MHGGSVGEFEPTCDRLVVCEPSSDGRGVADSRVHREQGLYVWDGVQLQYVDLAGDAVVKASGAALHPGSRTCA